MYRECEVWWLNFKNEDVWRKVPDGKVCLAHVFLFPNKTSFFSLKFKVVLFTRKLKEFLDSCTDCRGKYVLVPFSGEDNIIADVLVQMHKDANLQLDDEDGQTAQNK